MSKVKSRRSRERKLDGRRDSGSVADKTWTTMASVQSAWNGIYGLSRGIVGEIWEGKRGEGEVREKGATRRV